MSIIPLTNTRMQVLEVYKGSVGSDITVTQMAGTVPETEQHPGMIVGFDDDPVYAPGKDHVLFLSRETDSAGAKDRTLYWIVSP